MTTRSQDGRLDALLEAVLSEEVSAELRARYAADPSALDPEERRRIEERVAVSPPLADQIRILQEFEAAAALPADGAVGSGEARTGTPVRRAPPRRARWLRSGARLLAAAAAGVAAAIVFMRGPDVEVVEGPRVAALEAELARERVRVAALESERGGGPSEIDPPGDDATSLARRAAELEQQLVEARAAEEAARQELTALRDEAERQQQQIASLEVRLRESASRMAQVPPPRPSPPQRKPLGRDPLELEDPFQVAMVSSFEVPNPGDPAIRSALRSGGTPGIEIEALAPERAGWTLAAQPSLYWYTSGVSDRRVELAITRDEDETLVTERDLPAPVRPGIQRIDLSELGVTLEEGESYRWTVSLVIDPARRHRDVVTTGGIRRVASPAALADLDDATPPADRLNALERAGLWYDALDLVSRWIERRPDAENLVARREALLARAGIDSND